MIANGAENRTDIGFQIVMQDKCDLVPLQEVEVVAVEIVGNEALAPATMIRERFQDCPIATADRINANNLGIFI